MKKNVVGAAVKRMSSTKSNETEPEASSRSGRETKKPVRLIDEQTKETDSQQVKKIKLSTKLIEVFQNQPLPDRNKLTKELIFPDYPNFRPNLTPKEVMQVVVFTSYIYLNFLIYTNQRQAALEELISDLFIHRSQVTITKMNGKNSLLIGLRV